MVPPSKMRYCTLNSVFDTMDDIYFLVHLIILNENVSLVTFKSFLGSYSSVSNIGTRRTPRAYLVAIFPCTEEKKPTIILHILFLTRWRQISVLLEGLREYEEWIRLVSAVETSLAFGIPVDAKGRSCFRDSTRLSTLNALLNLS